MGEYLLNNRQEFESRDDLDITTALSARQRYSKAAKSLMCGAHVGLLLDLFWHFDLFYPVLYKIRR
jgi:hypothetical protein